MSGASDRSRRFARRIDKVLAESYEIRRIVGQGKQPSKRQLQGLLRALSLANEDVIHIVADYGAPVSPRRQRPGQQVELPMAVRARKVDDSIVLGEAIASAMTVLARAGWRSQKISRQDIRYISEALKEAADLVERR